MRSSCRLCVCDYFRLSLLGNGLVATHNFFNPILFASCICIFSNWCKSKKKKKKKMRREVERPASHLQIQQAQGLVCP
jgi:hypothetical protein